MEKSTKIWMCISGLALVVLGVLCIAYPLSVLMSVSWLIGLVFFVSGCTEMAAWGKLRHIVQQSGLMFFTALLKILLSLMILIFPAPIMIALPFLFALWLMFEGINILVTSFDFKQIGFKKWWIMLLIGIVMACFGIYGLLNPQASADAIGLLVGIGIIIDGVGNWTKLALIKKAEKRLAALRDRYKAALEEIKKTIDE